VPRAFYDRDPCTVAPELLHKVLVTPVGSGRIVEVEAYDGANDAGSHAFRGRTPRTEVMFGPPGHLYVYFTYGMHWCANVVCRGEGDAAAILLRALAPRTGLDHLRANRPAARTDRDLCSGPAKLCEALGIDGLRNGVDVTRRASWVRVVDDGVAPPDAPVVTTRIGLSRGGELPWRWYVPGDPNVSRR
jgi:DNA-3-methyladenine glycosylase